MMANLGRAYVLGQIEQSLAARDPAEVRTWATKWLKGEVSFIEDLLKDRIDELRPYKAIAIQVLQRLTVDDLRRACHGGRPELDDVWDSGPARQRMESELKEIGAFLSTL